MGKITSFDRATTRRVAERIEAALAELGKELGCSIKYKGGNYGAGNCTVKLEVAALAPDGTVKTKDAEMFTTMARFYGMKPEDLGRTFRSSGKTFTISGLAPKSRVRPILATTDGGKTFKFAAEDVVRALMVAA